MPMMFYSLADGPRRWARACREVSQLLAHRPADVRAARKTRDASGAAHPAGA
jgi:hypothetical protein